MEINVKRYPCKQSTTFVQMQNIWSRTSKKNDANKDICFGCNCKLLILYAAVIFLVFLKKDEANINKSTIKYFFIDPHLDH